MNWARMLKRVFNIDMERCPNCGGALKIIAAIEDPPVIAKILTHLNSPALRRAHRRAGLISSRQPEDPTPTLGPLSPEPTKRREITPSGSCGRGNFHKRLGCLTAQERSDTVLFGKRGRLKCLFADQDLTRVRYAANFIRNKKVQTN